MANLTFRIYSKIFKTMSESNLSRYGVVSKIGRNLHSKLKPNFVEMYGNKIYLDPLDHHLLSIQDYPIHRIIKETIKPGDTVIDIGVNIGILTVYFAKLVGKYGRVYAFEPEPSNFALLSKNAEVNGYKNIILEKKAVSDKSGTVNLQISEYMTAHRIYQGIGKDNKFVEVDCISLDDYFKNYSGEIHFIKIDTEGNDGKVIQGSTEILAKYHDAKIMTEFHTRLLKEAGMNPEEFIQILSENFKIYDLCAPETERMILLKSEDLVKFAQKDNSTNLFCTR